MKLMDQVLLQREVDRRQRKMSLYLFLIKRKYILKSWTIYSLIFIKESYNEDN